MADTGGIKRQNAALLRKTIGDGREYSKNKLTQKTGLSFPTVSRIVDEMVETGEMRETGVAASTGGRCARKYARDPAFRLFLCLRLEGRSLCWFISDLADERLEQDTMLCEDGVLQTIDTLLMRVKARYPRLAAVSMGFAGTMRDGKVTEAFDYPELRGVSLKTYLYERAGVPCAAARDMQVVAAGYAARQPQPPRAAVCIYIGPAGIGSAIVLDGKVWRGASGFAGELHYLPIRNNLEYAKTHFAGADMVAYYMQVIRAYAALLNPDRVVLYNDPLLEGKTGRIRRACAQTLPPQALPEIVLSSAFAKDYEAGLLALARKLMEETE